VGAPAEAEGAGRAHARRAGTAPNPSNSARLHGGSGGSRGRGPCGRSGGRKQALTLVTTPFLHGSKATRPCSGSTGCPQVVPPLNAAPTCCTRSHIPVGQLLSPSTALRAGAWTTGRVTDKGVPVGWARYQWRWTWVHQQPNR